MLYLYALVLMFAAGLFGAFCRAFLLGLGFVPNLESSLYIFFSAGCIYLFVQCFMMCGFRLYSPTTGRSFYFSEIGSNGAVLVLVPYILHVSIPWPYSVLERAEGLVYLIAFCTVHLFLKLSSFYASLRGGLSNRKGAIAYAGIAFVSLLMGVYLELRWIDSLEAARTQVSETMESMKVGSIRANARAMTEGGSFGREVRDSKSPTITTRWSRTSNSDVERIYTTFVMQGSGETVYQSSTALSADAWSEIRVPNEYIPDNLRSFEVRWTRTKEPNWQRILGLRPIVYNLPDTPGGEAPLPKVVMMSGPFVHGERPQARTPNIVLILIDGLAANHLSMMGYEREVSPSLDRLGYGGLSFPNMYSSSMNVGEMLGSLVDETMVSRLGASGYSTVAYTEGETISGADLDYGSAIGAGFQMFDSDYNSGRGSGVTIQKAQKWIDGHRSVAFFMLVRLRGLEDVASLKDVEGAYPESGRARAVDMFDNGLQRLDSQLGSLLKYIRDHDTRKNTFIFLLSPYGHTFSLRSGGALQDEVTLRTPLIINGPGMRKAKVSTRVETDDVRATISAITGVDLGGSGTGKSVL